MTTPEKTECHFKILATLRQVKGHPAHTQPIKKPGTSVANVLRDVSQPGLERTTSALRHHKACVRKNHPLEALPIFCRLEEPGGILGLSLLFQDFSGAAKELLHLLPRVDLPRPRLKELFKQGVVLVYRIRRRALFGEEMIPAE